VFDDFPLTRSPGPSTAPAVLPESAAAAWCLKQSEDTKEGQHQDDSDDDLENQLPVREEEHRDQHGD
jgi:hypothetical protein